MSEGLEALEYITEIGIAQGYAHNLPQDIVDLLKEVLL